MLIPSVLVGVVMMVVVVGAQRQVMMRGYGEDDDIPVCGAGSVYQRSRRTCPPRAVCADVWDTVRDWHNGTRCRDHRVMFNCICPDSRECPIDNPDHVLYANDKQSQYLCQPACELEACRTEYRAAKEMVRSMNRRRSFGYYRMNCRCADHHVPLPSRGRNGRLNRATRYKRLFFDRRNRLVYTQYTCTNYIEGDSDPCQFQ